MHSSLTYLATLPDSTVVYSGHEYTAGNLSFAKSVDPSNKSLEKLQAIVDSQKITQGVSTIADEKEWNVFMRLGSDAVRFATAVFNVTSSLHACYRKATEQTSDSAIMDTLRDQKNNFRG